MRVELERVRGRHEMREFESGRYLLRVATDGALARLAKLLAQRGAAHHTHDAPAWQVERVPGERPPV